VFCMTRCEVCGNDYSMPIIVEAQGVRHTFDSFDCAIHRMAPVCEHCRVRITGTASSTMSAEGRVDPPLWQVAAVRVVPSKPCTASCCPGNG